MAGFLSSRARVMLGSTVRLSMDSSSFKSCYFPGMLLNIDQRSDPITGFGGVRTAAADEAPAQKPFLVLAMMLFYHIRFGFDRSSVAIGVGMQIYRGKLRFVSANKCKLPSLSSLLSLGYIEWMQIHLQLHNSGSRRMSILWELTARLDCRVFESTSVLYASHTTHNVNMHCHGLVPTTVWPAALGVGSSDQHSMQDFQISRQRP